MASTKNQIELFLQPGSYFVGCMDYPLAQELQRTGVQDLGTG